MIVIGTFDYLPTDDMFPYIFPDLPESEAYTSKFDRLGLSFAYLVMNLGSLFIIFTINIMIYLIYLPIKMRAPRSKCAAVFEKKIKRKMFWNTAIIFM